MNMVMVWTPADIVGVILLTLCIGMTAAAVLINKVKGIFK